MHQIGSGYLLFTLATFIMGQLFGFSTCQLFHLSALSAPLTPQNAKVREAGGTRFKHKASLTCSNSVFVVVLVREREREREKARERERERERERKKEREREREKESGRERKKIDRNKSE